MKKILVVGGSGMIGRTLSQHLVTAGYSVHWLSRWPDDGSYPTHRWSIAQGQMDDEALHDVWGVINLSGAGIVDKRWTHSRKKILIESRVKGNILLIERILQLKAPPKVFLGASAIGIYGNRPQEIINEYSDLGSESEFLVSLCKDWEASSQVLEDTSIERVLVRIGLVLSPRGGLLKRLKQTMPLGIGGYFGNGKQGASWIHIDDLCRMMLFALVGASGTYNGVAPNPCGFKDLVRAIAKCKGLGVTLPIPEMMLRWSMGERSEAILQDLTAVPAAAQQAGFRFLYPSLDLAVDQLMC